MNFLRPKTFEKEEFSNKSLPRLVHLAKYRSRTGSSIMIIVFTILSDILSTIVPVWNDKIFMPFSVMIVALGQFSYWRR
jgi:hypothetical protein